MLSHRHGPRYSSSCFLLCVSSWKVILKSSMKTDQSWKQGQTPTEHVRNRTRIIFVCLVRICICWNVSDRFLVVSWEKKKSWIYIYVEDEESSVEKNRVRFFTFSSFYYNSYVTLKLQKWQWIMMPLADNFRQMRKKMTPLCLDRQEAENHFFPTFKNVSTTNIFNTAFIPSLPLESPDFQIKTLCQSFSKQEAYY